MNMGMFLALAVVIALVCFAGLGGWLLPQWGIEGMAANAICGGISGALIAILYVRMVKRPGGA